MYQGIIIVNHQYGMASGPIEYKIKRFKEEFLKFDCQLIALKNDGSLSYIDNTGNIILNLPKFDFIIYLDKDKYLLQILKKENAIVFNEPDFIQLCDDKMLTHIRLSNLNISMPKTIPGPLNYNLKDDNFNQIIDNIIDKINFPMLIKGVYGSMGLNMLLVRNKKELLDGYSKMKKEPLLFQEYITSSYGKSLRVLVVDKKIVGTFLRYNDNDYRSNFSIGAKSMPYQLNEEYIEFVNKIVNELNISYAGIDLLFGKDNKPILCEINPNAFFSEFEKVTNVNVAKLFANMVIKKIKNVVE